MSNEKEENNTQDNINPNNAGPLLQSMQQLRVHWSGIIVSVLNFTIILIVAIWSYFLRVYFESDAGNKPEYIALAAASSAVVIGFWRLYTHYIDNRIAQLYPDFLLYEYKCGINPESDYGTSGYLKRAVKRMKNILCDTKLGPTNRIKGIRKLVEERQAGGRVHGWIDLSSVIYVLAMLFITSYVMRNELQSLALRVYLSVILLGLGLIVLGNRIFQKNPSETCIEDILSKLRRNSKQKGSRD